MQLETELFHTEFQVNVPPRTPLRLVTVTEKDYYYTYFLFCKAVAVAVWHSGMTADTQHLFVASIISIKMTGHFPTKIRMKTLTVMISLSSRVSCGEEEDSTVGLTLTLIGVFTTQCRAQEAPVRLQNM